MQTKLEVKIKYVPKAGLWCVTYFIHGKQAQEWCDTVVQARDFRHKLEQNEKDT